MGINGYGLTGYWCVIGKAGVVWDSNAGTPQHKRIRSVSLLHAMQVSLKEKVKYLEGRDDGVVY